MIKRAFTEHPASVGENYFQHLCSASSFAGAMFINSFACLLHGIFPFLFVKTGSKCITQLHDRMVTNRHRHPPAQDVSISKPMQGAE